MDSPAHTVTGRSHHSPSHADRPQIPMRLLLIAAAVAALLGAVAFGAASCQAEGAPSRGTPTSASPITLAPVPGTAPGSP